MKSNKPNQGIEYWIPFFESSRNTATDIDVSRSILERIIPRTPPPLKGVPHLHSTLNSESSQIPHPYLAAVSKNIIQKNRMLGMVPIQLLPAYGQIKSKLYVTHLLSGLVFHREINRKVSTDNIWCRTFITNNTFQQRSKLYFDTETNNQNLDSDVKQFIDKMNQYAINVLNPLFDLAQANKHEIYFPSAITTLNAFNIVKNYDFAFEKKPIKTNPNDAMHKLLKLFAREPDDALGIAFNENNNSYYCRYQGVFSSPQKHIERCFNFEAVLNKTLEEIDPEFKKLTTTFKENILAPSVKYAPLSDSVPVILNILHQSDLMNYFVENFDITKPAETQLESMTDDKAQLFKLLITFMLKTDLILEIKDLLEQGQPITKALKKSSSNYNSSEFTTLIEHLIQKIKNNYVPPLVFTDAGDEDPDDEYSILPLINSSILSDQPWPILVLHNEKNSQTPPDTRMKTTIETIVKFSEDSPHITPEKLEKVFVLHDSNQVKDNDYSTFDIDSLKTKLQGQSLYPNSMLILCPLSPVKDVFRSMPELSKLPIFIQA